jgi:hypothetical protein
LLAARAKLRQLVKEVLHDDPPTPSISSRSRGEGSPNDDHKPR